MKDISLEKYWKFFIYRLGWLAVILTPLWWIVVASLYQMYNFGDKPRYDKNKERILYRTFEKFIYRLGWIYLVFVIPLVVIFNIVIRYAVS